ncbi:MAG: precorrin-6y C5,15-methyltransferase (decarboxylating) subunit CbiE [Anaerocolumna sp.]
MKEVVLIGIGMGNLNTLTMEGKKAIEEAQILIGAKRILEGVQATVTKKVLIESRKIAEFIEQSECSRFAVLFSGDTGFYSGANSLRPLLTNYQVRTIPGISSLSYFSAKIGISWEDAFVLSIHGRKSNVVKAVAEHYKTFLLTQGNVASVCKDLMQAGLEDVIIYIGENLSYLEENIAKGYPKDFYSKEFSSLSVMLIINEKYKKEFKIGIKDDEFMRGNVPMTKSEIRAISISKLYLKENAIMYDIGAGTGSISVEAAMLCDRGRVYAIEEKAEAVELIQSNVEKFGLDNVTICHGSAPACIMDLETPDCAFIGGSRGNLRSIIEVLLDKNKNIFIVINAITLETLMEALDIMKEYFFCDVEIVQAFIAKTKEIGSYHMLMGQNPIFIVSGKGSGKG